MFVAVLQNIRTDAVAGLTNYTVHHSVFFMSTLWPKNINLQSDRTPNGPELKGDIIFFSFSPNQADWGSSQSAGLKLLVFDPEVSPSSCPRPQCFPQKHIRWPVLVLDLSIASQTSAWKHTRSVSWDVLWLYMCSHLCRTERFIPGMSSKQQTKLSKVANRGWNHAILMKTISTIQSFFWAVPRVILSVIHTQQNGGVSACRLVLWS